MVTSKHCGTQKAADDGHQHLEAQEPYRKRQSLKQDSVSGSSSLYPRGPFGVGSTP